MINQHMIVMQYLQKIFDLPFLAGQPNSNEYLKMLNRVNQLIRVMPAFGYDVKKWDPILMYCLVARLDSNTVQKWTKQIRKR